MRYLVFLSVLLAAACASQPVNRIAASPLPVASIELDRYLGRWREAARLPNSFEAGCAGATAEYALRDDGLISVRNTCIREDGRTNAAVGRARRAGQGDEGKLEVSFFGPFWADYWVLERAPDYSWSIVGEPSGRYLWVLSRDAHISPEQRAAFEARLSALGYDVSKLVWNTR